MEQSKDKRPVNNFCDASCDRRFGRARWLQQTASWKMKTSALAGRDFRASDLISATMDGISIASFVIAILQVSAKVITYVNDIKDASEVCQQFQVEASHLNTLLLQLNGLIADAKPEDAWTKHTILLGRSDGLLRIYQSELVALQKKVKARKNGHDLFRKLAWKHVAEDVRKVLDTIERIKSVVIIALEMDHMELSHAIKDEFPGVHIDLDRLQRHTGETIKAIPRIESTIASLHVTQSYEQYQEARLWLSPIDHIARAHDILGKRTLGTGD